MTSVQVTALLALLDKGAEPATVAESFGVWCDEHIQPWVADHIGNDDVAVERWQGAELDLSRPLTSMAIHEAAEVDPRIYQYSGPFLSTTAPPGSLAPAEPWARAVYESGWRPEYSEGPTRDEFVPVIDRALTSTAGDVIEDLDRGHGSLLSLKVVGEQSDGPATSGVTPEKTWA